MYRIEVTHVVSTHPQQAFHQIRPRYVKRFYGPLIASTQWMLGAQKQVRLACFHLISLAVTCLLPAFGQPPPAQQLARLKEQIQRDSSLSTPDKQLLAETYNKAISNWQLVLRFEQSAKSNLQSRTLANAEAAKLAAEMLDPSAITSTGLDLNPEDIKEAFEAALSERDARQRLLNKAAKDLQDLNQKADAIRQRHAQLRERFSAPTTDKAKAPALLDRYSQASRLEAEAQRAALEAETKSLAAERAYLDAVRELIPLQSDSLKLKIEASERTIAALKERSREALVRESSQQLRSALDIAATSVNLVPALAPVAAEVRALASGLWDSGGMLQLNQEIASQNQRLQQQSLRVISLTEGMKRRYEAAGLFAPAGEWLRSFPPDLPDLKELERMRRRNNSVRVRLRRDTVALEEKSRFELSLEAQVEAFRAAWTRSLNPASRERQIAARRLLQVRRSLSEQVLKNGQDLEANLNEYADHSTKLRDQLEQVRTFSTQRIVWSRSVGEPFQFVNWLGGLNWWLFNSDWTLVARSLWLWLTAGVALISFLHRSSIVHKLLPAVHPRLALHLALTLFWAIPIPLLGFQLSWLLNPVPDPFARALQAGLSSTSAFLLVLLPLKLALAPTGVLTRILLLPAPVGTHLAKSLHRLTVVLAPFVLLIFGMLEVGNLLSDSSLFQSFHNAFGRSCYLLSLGYVSFQLLLPQPELLAWLQARGPIHQNKALKLRNIAILLLILLALLAIAGFYSTSLFFSRNLFWTCAVTGILKSISVPFKKSLRDLVEDSPPSTTAPTHTSAAQLHQLVHFALTLIWITAMILIWPRLVPAIEYLDSIPFGDLNLSSSPASPSPLISFGPVSIDPAPSNSSATKTGLTFYTLLQALGLSLIFTIFVKNLPGLLDYVLRYRFRLHYGSVYAAAAILRYALFVLGVTLISRILGLDWGKVQWLAAALSFGIGFGLQEIFANFGSGIILLLDRSIRVGDAVSVGEWTGRVSRIQMRATTLTLWDRSEMVVPNREFITSKLINWTLSLPESRVDVKLSVPFGSNVGLVRECLFQVAASNPNVLKSPKPEVLLTSFAESGIQFELRAFGLFEYGRHRLLDELHTAVFAEFEQAGIRLSSPALEVKLASPNP